MHDAIVVLITASSGAEAETLAMALVSERLAACVNIVPAIRSVFVWDGALQKAEETLLIAKSRRPVLDKLVSRVKELHSYTVPEIISLPLESGSADYLAWLSESVPVKTAE
jgi:periplasmic divalent cation tolerance protein